MSQNPAYTLPQEHAPPYAPAKEAPGVWDGGRNTLRWLTPGAGTIIRQAVWNSPRFDLRPEFLGTMQERPVNVQPIFRSGFGSGGQLFVQVLGLHSTIDATADLRVIMHEFVSPNNPTPGPFGLGGLAQIAQQDISTEVITDEPTAILVFVPPGEGNPIRYWQIRLDFRFYAAHVTWPDFTIAAAYY